MITENRAELEEFIFLIIRNEMLKFAESQTCKNENWPVGRINPSRGALKKLLKPKGRLIEFILFLLLIMFTKKRGSEREGMSEGERG